jgi:tRNA(Leu) C34 or U34 (ribose-2'-O)-methylase TrmL
LSVILTANPLPNSFISPIPLHFHLCLPDSPLPSQTVDVHNYSAVIRTAEALGVQDLYLIAPPVKLSPDGSSFIPFDPLSAKTLNQKKKNKRKQGLWKADEDKAVRHQGYARTACKWINTHEFGSTTACVKQLREEGFDLWVTDLGQKAVPLVTGPDAMELPEKLAIVFGTESTGCTKEMLDAADKRVYLPLSGFADSLNLSVAAAMVIQRLFFMKPELEGDITDDEKRELRSVWYPCLARNKEQDKKYR